MEKELTIKLPEERVDVIQTLDCKVQSLQTVCIFRLNSALFPEIQSTLFRYFRAGISA